MIMAGVDPGFSGAIAVLHCPPAGAGRPQIRALWDMPVVTKTVGKKYILDDLLNLVRAVSAFDPVKFLVEDVSGRGHQKGSSTFGYGVGLLHMAATAAHLPLEIVRPDTWKPHLRCPAEKRGATKLAASLIEGGDKRFYGPKGGVLDGRAEACLLAYWGWTKASRIGRAP